MRRAARVRPQQGLQQQVAAPRLLAVDCIVTGTERPTDYFIYGRYLRLRFVLLLRFSEERDIYLSEYSIFF